jgi:ElaB/YqjD/DUF883 family membrane-anchored ribosome-binding protein
MTAYKANQRLSKHVKLVMRDAEDLVRLQAGNVSDKIGRFRHGVASTFESARGSYGRLRDGTVRAAKATHGVIREHPYQSLGIALGTGLVLGALARRRW